MDDFRTVTIRFTSRASVQIKGSYYTFEATIEKQCPEAYTDSEYMQAKQELWDECNGEVDAQVEQVVDMLRNKK